MQSTDEAGLGDTRTNSAEASSVCTCSLRHFLEIKHTGQTTVIAQISASDWVCPASDESIGRHKRPAKSNSVAVSSCFAFPKGNPCLSFGQLSRARRQSSQASKGSKSTGYDSTGGSGLGISTPTMSLRPAAGSDVDRIAYNWEIAGHFRMARTSAK